MINYYVFFADKRKLSSTASTNLTKQSGNTLNNTYKDEKTTRHNGLPGFKVFL